jgi:hypothetical protein
VLAPSSTRRSLSVAADPASGGPAGPRDVTAAPVAAPGAPTPPAAPGAPERFRAAPACASGVAAVGPDGATLCVPATPAARAQASSSAHPTGGAALFDVFGLPFTGVDAAAVLILGICALALGLALHRRRARPRGIGGA